MPPPLPVLDSARFALLGRLVERLDATGVDADVRATVDLLTAAAEPDRAERLALRPGEPPALVERLAVWALRRVGDAAVVAAGEALTAPPARDTRTRRSSVRGPSVVAGCAAARTPATGAATHAR